MRTLAVLHLGELSGPSKTLRPRLERLAEWGPVDLVVPPGGSGAADSYRSFASVTTLDYEALLVPSSAAGALRAAGSSLRELRAFRSLIRRVRPDLAVIATLTLPAALVAAKLERVPAVVAAMEILDGGGRGRARRLGGSALLRLERGLADALVCCSDAVGGQFAGRRTGARVATVYPGIPDRTGGNGEALRARLGLVHARPLIATVGNVTRGRGQDLAIRALATVARSSPRAALAIVGMPHPRPVDLAYRQQLDDLADRLGVGDRVVYPGFIERIEDVYAAADVVVNPARAPEAFGQVAPEALVGRCPVVATRVGAIPEVLRDGTDALLVEPEDPDAIAAAVTGLASDDELAGRLVAQGRERVLERFTERSSVDGFVELVGEVLDHTPRRQRASG